MSTPTPPASALRTVGLLALLGIATVFLSGPILAVASVVLSVALVICLFALIGLLVWAPFYALYAGGDAAVHKVGQMGRALGLGLAHAGRASMRAVALPPRAAWWLARQTGRLGRAAGEVGLVGLSGAGFGALIGLAMAMTQHLDPGTVVPTNALVGGAIAALVGLVFTLFKRKPRPEEEILDVQPVDRVLAVGGRRA